MSRNSHLITRLVPCRHNTSPNVIQNFFSQFLGCVEISRSSSAGLVAIEAVRKQLKWAVQNPHPHSIDTSFTRCPIIFSAQDAMMANVFEPLDRSSNTIRLLKIRTIFTGPLDCTLHTFNSDDVRPSYTALSYRWGPSASTSSTIINGVAVEMRQNLHDGLLAIRKQTLTHPTELKYL